MFTIVVFMAFPIFQISMDHYYLLMILVLILVIHPVYRTILE